MSNRSDGRIERGILFNSEMVRAIRDGRKTETRRPVKFLPGHETPPVGFGTDAAPMSCDWIQGRPAWFSSTFGGCQCAPCARAQLAFEGNILWVKETFIAGKAVGGYAGRAGSDQGIDGPTIDVIYRADDGENECGAGPWTPSIHMPRGMARILLEVTDVRVERLQAITEEGAKAEGVEPKPGRRIYPGSGAARVQSYRDGFMQTWDQIYADKGLGWSENPWVWVYEFKLLEGGE